MEHYNGYPLTTGHVVGKSNLIVDKCPYCGRTEHHHYTKYTTNPTRRKSHCLRWETCDYYYVYITNLKGGEDTNE